MTKAFKIIISGGGTGGHIYPAVSIANELMAQFPKAEILFVGAMGKMEMEKVPKAGYQIVGLPIAGISRSSILANLSFPFKLLKSLYLARKTLVKFKPSIAIGVGGYASGPTLLMANFLGIKSLIQEQNSFAGITNKFLAKKAQTVCVAYPNMEKFFPKQKIVFTGNPVRSDILNKNMTKKEACTHFGLNAVSQTVLIIGGSQGARSINQCIYKHVDKLLTADLQIIWQTGKVFYPMASEKKDNMNSSALFVSDFIYEMDFAYAAADLVISRAGALSVSELCLTAKPSILIPFPSAAEDHQTKNALSLVEKNAALMVKDHNLEEKLINECLSLARDKQKQEDLATNIKEFARPMAAKDIVEEIKKISLK